jgi:phospholipid/cholesterol/gamma-HCH transport system permease protein
MEVVQTKPSQGMVVLRRKGEDLTMVLAGWWHLGRDLPSASLLTAELDAGPAVKRIGFDATELRHWDSGLIVFLRGVGEICRARGIVQVRDELPRGLRRLIELAEAVPETKGARGAAARDKLLARIGKATIAYATAAGELLAFVGELSVAFVRLVQGKARYRRIDFAETMQESGASAVGIVALIAFLVGVILAFMGAVQLAQFGATIYVADLVGIGMVREMGAMMTAIIMSGRTGAAFAAQLGTMKVTQEIDAFATMGISPLEFLVVPRALGLIVMMPLLCLFADLVGIAGGLSVGVAMLNLTAANYLRETISTLTLTNLFGGLLKATVYGSLIAIAGCLQGLRCGRSSSAVGDAATQAVVMSIVLVVTACGIFAVLFNILGI